MAAAASIPFKVVHLVCGARPNFMKVAPLYHELKIRNFCEPLLIHTGQHYDFAMSESFFSHLRLPAPHHNLGIGGGSHARQTAGVMNAYEKLCVNERPDWTVVVGDVNSTLAATLSAVKLHIPVAHLEAGLRSGDRSMPEEINRLVTDSLADLLWTPSPDADDNLRREGVAEARIERVGNIMIDSYEMMRSSIESVSLLETAGVAAGEYGVVTLHRPVNVDHAQTLALAVSALCDCQKLLPLVFPVHPRTSGALKRFGLEEPLCQAGVQLLPPLGYIPFMALVRGARLVVTDSGGIQEETTYLGIPCLTARATTERPITVSQGSNRLVELADIPREVARVMSSPPPRQPPPALWDGKTAGRVADSLLRHLG